MSQIYNPSAGGGGSGDITLEGNTGGPLGPSDSFTIVTSNANVGFDGSGTTLTLNFAYDVNQDASTTNLLLGSNGSTISSAVGNTLLGVVGMTLISSGISNTAIGHASMSTISTGNFNTAIGEGTMFSCNGGCIGNTALGWHSLITIVGDYNIGIGYNVMGMGVTGDRNIGIGYFPLENLLTGSNNIGIGSQAGFAYAGAESSNICIANQGVALESNTLRIGTQGSGLGEIDTAFIAGVAEVSVSNLQGVTIDTTTGQLGSAPGVSFTLKSALVDMTSGTVQAMLTSPSSGSFVVTSIVEYGQNVTGVVTPATYNIGWTAPNYDDLISLNSTQVMATSTYSPGPPSGASLPFVIPASTNISINVTVAATATTYDEYFYLTGFILF